MKFNTYLPCEVLCPYIKYFIVSESDVTQTYKVLPGTSLVMGFQYNGGLMLSDNGTDMPLSTAGITGIIGACRTFKNSANTGTVLVVFTETGAANFFRLPLNELFDESTGLDNMFNRRQLADTQELLAAATDDRGRLMIVEQLLLKHLHTDKTDSMVATAVAIIQAAKGNIRISELAVMLNTSASPLEKRFRKFVGATPKKFASIVRMRATMEILQHHNYPEILFLSGYYDQAHLVHNFKAFTGTTPEQYLRDIQLMSK